MVLYGRAQVALLQDPLVLLVQLVQLVQLVLTQQCLDQLALLEKQTLVHSY
jgi:hypothetical protein